MQKQTHILLDIPFLFGKMDMRELYIGKLKSGYARTLYRKLRKMDMRELYRKIVG